MNKAKDEPRSWPEGADGEEALEALKSGLERVRSHVADLRQHLAPPGQTAGSDEAS